jgi:peroxiredoxin
VDEIWCVSVNDAFVMGAWARDQKDRQAKFRMLADGSAAFTQATGITLDLNRQRYGRAQQPLFDAGQGWQSDHALNIEGPGKFEVSDGATLLAQRSSAQQPGAAFNEADR